MSDPAHQTAPQPPYPADVSAFADALEAVMDDGTHDLAGIVAALNQRAGAASPWTEATLAARLEALAQA